jgi:hypothetical protein
MLLWQLKLQKPFAWDQQLILQKSLQQLLAGATGGRCIQHATNACNSNAHLVVLLL